ncbi:MAG: hydroxyacid dehydrogenase [Candidatus Kerfeldbacteria bacterium]|nr:hydroxyacid dehydrogenase [Candidatus Kerfeldbacteria bacterium]
MNQPILFLEREPWEQEFLKGRFDGSIGFSAATIDKIPADRLKNVSILVAFIHSAITEAVLERIPNLKFVTTRSTGYDHIDLQACAKRGVLVSNVPTYGENTVAEHTVALVLALSRKLIPSIERTRRGDFRLDDLRGFDLKGKTIGLIGSGHIGSHVAQYAVAFGMHVLAFDPKPNLELAKKLGFSYVSFNDLLPQSDIISLHVPFLPSTKHLLNDAAFKKMKRGVVIINTARGGLIDTKALVRALKNGTVAAAGLDVLEEECEITEERELLTDAFKQQCDLETVLANHILLEQPNVIITPHNAFNSQEALERILTTTIANIKAFQAGQPINVVNV